MKKALALMAVVLSLGLTVAMDAEARRMGGGKSAGMQRQNITAPAKTPGAPTQAAPAAGTAAAAAAAPAAAAKRSWMGPIAGLAAGLGLAALASHLGFGEAFGNMLMIGLLVMAALALVTFVMRKRAAAQGGALAGAGAAGGFARPQQAQDVAFRTAEAPRQNTAGGSMIGSRLAGGSGALGEAGTQVGSIPADFDVPAFERNAKDQFMALQSANDTRDLARLRDYLSADMFDVVRADIAERGDAAQQTEVFGLQAQVLDVAQEADRYVVSVRFTGSTREQHGAVPEDLDETWHLVKPKSGFGGWVIAGIQQNT